MAGTRKTVLWVDDEIEFLRAHILFLETRGYTVVPTYSGDDAIQLIREKPTEFDIVLLDEQMPGKNGIATLEEIKELLPDLPVVMVTKSEEEQLMEDALGKKIDGYLTKPVNPSQILSVCKRLLDSKQILSSQISQKFIRGYSENRVQLAGVLDVNGWVRMYENLTKWDLELEKVEDEGLRQTHAGQKSDANALFSSCVAENYPRWAKGQGAPPVFSTQVAEKYLYPRLRDGKKVYFVVLDSMRLDQYLAVEPLLRQYFTVERRYYYSILPSSTCFARGALFGGMFPLELAEKSPRQWKQLAEDGADRGAYESKLLQDKLRLLGIKFGRKPCYENITDSRDSQAFLTNIERYESAPLVSIVVNFVDLLIHSRSTSAILKEIAPDESAFRSLTQSWFQYSTLLQIFRELSHQDCTVILTTDHGSVYCTRGTEVYGQKGAASSLRYRCGEGMTCDERHAVFLADPSLFRLPSFGPGTSYAIARENYYFTGPEKFEDYQLHSQHGFQHGGISLEEMIVPLAIMEPRLC